MVRVAVDKETNNIQARSLVARDVEKHVRCSSTEKKQKWAIEKPKFIDPADARVQGNDEKCAKTVGSFDASSYALQDQVKKAQGDL